MINKLNDTIACRALFFNLAFYIGLWTLRIPTIKDQLETNYIGIGYILTTFALGSILIMVFSNKIINGRIVIAPNKNLTKVKVKGPTYSIPVACATKAVPHITDASKSRRLPLKVSNFYNLFNFIAFSLLIHQVSITIPYSGILSG